MKYLVTNKVLENKFNESKNNVKFLKNIYCQKRDRNELENLERPKVLLEGFNSVILRNVSWLCAQVSFLAVLRGPFVALVIEPRSLHT